jgi:hypothetical protein
MIAGVLHLYKLNTNIHASCPVVVAVVVGRVSSGWLTKALAANERERVAG